MDDERARPGARAAAKTMAEPDTYKDFVLQLGQWLLSHYWGPMWKTVKDNPDLVRTIPGFLIHPDKVIYYMGRTHIGIEYVGPERLNQLPPNATTLDAQCFDYSLRDCNLLDEIIGLNFGGGADRTALPPVIENLILPTNAGFDELCRVNWNWSAQDMILGLNANGVMAPEGQFTRIVNGRFFDAGETGLKVRYIRWLDLIPCKYDDSGDEVDTFKINLSPFEKLAEIDPYSLFPLPNDFRLDRLQRVNRFIEMLGNRSLSEPQITRALASEQFRFILSMRFSAKALHTEVSCEWQGVNLKAIKPDFFVVGPDGFADIVEFKLPELNGNTVVGRDNRGTFSAQINSYIAQTRVYRDYFDDPRNREYIENRHGFKVYKPRRFLIIGRRWHFNNSEWRAIAADYHELTIMTYDDLIDGVVAQFYG